MLVFKVGQIFKRTPVIKNANEFQILRLNDLEHFGANFSVIESFLYSKKTKLYMDYQTIRDCLQPEQTGMNSKWELIYDVEWTCSLCKYFSTLNSSPHHASKQSCWLCSLDT